MFDHNFLERLREIVGVRGLLSADDLAGRDSGIDATNLDAGVAVLPEKVSQVSAVLALCNARRVSVVSHGGLTGLAGAAASHPGQLIVSTSRLNQICDIDPMGGTALIDAGVTLEVLNNSAGAHGLCSGIDIGARGTATIGGMIATNAGGGEAFRYGVMRHRVLGLEAVCADGTVLSDLKRVTKSNEGLDVKQLFIGSEGTLGVVTKAVLKLEPVAGEMSTALVACDSAAQAVLLFHALRTSPHLDLTKAEIMWRDYAQVTAHDLDLSALLSFADRSVYLLLDGAMRDLERDAFADVLVAAMEDIGIDDAIIAQSERERANMWQIREDSWGVQRQYPNGLWFDVSVPQSLMDDYVAAVCARIDVVDQELRVFVMGHLGDGNLHFTITKGVPIAELYPSVSDAVYDGLREMGGSFSAEHGIGTEKKSALAALCDPGKLDLMKTIKRAFDPNGIMNPGKVLD